jgi:hypothetical protein
VAEVVDDGQALDAPAAGQCVHHEVQAPHLVARLGLQQWHAFIPDSLCLAALAHRQVVVAVQTPHTLVVDCMAFTGEQVVDAPIAKVSAFMRQLDDARAQHHGLRVCRRRLAIAGSG